MNVRIAIVALLGVCCNVSNALWAHPGHGSTAPQTWVHHTTEWVHVGPFWGVAFAAVAAGALLWRLQRRHA